MIDLRSDTVTRPTAAMKDAMMRAPVGDDVFDDDPTVHALQDFAAQRLGKEAGLFLASGTMSNLAGLMAHCGRGDEYLVSQNAHTFRYEAGGAAVLGSIQPQPLEPNGDGTIELGRIEAAIKPEDVHFARTRLLTLENTTGGRVLPQAYVEAATDLARHHGLGTHLDGARIFNASVAQGIDVREITRNFDTVSCCLSKGLGAPVGSVLVGPAELIERAHKWRKMLGGGWRQAGLLAAAGLHALEHHVERLSDDHANAERLAEALNRRDVFEATQHTNILWLKLNGRSAAELIEHFRAYGIQVTGRGDTLRLVTHLDVTSEDVDKVIEVADAF